MVGGRAVGRRVGERSGAAGADGREPRLRAAVRPRVLDLCQRLAGPVHARPARGQAGSRSASRAGRGARGTAEDHPAAAGEVGGRVPPGPPGPLTLSTHVLDATAGRPAAEVPVRLERRGPDGWSPAGAGQTGADGRLRLDDGPGIGPGFEPGVYRITFGSGAYFAARGIASFYA